LPSIDAATAKPSSSEPLLDRKKSLSKTGRKTPEELYEVVTVPPASTATTATPAKLSPLPPLQGTSSNPSLRGALNNQVPSCRRRVLEVASTIIGELELSDCGETERMEDDEIIEMFIAKGAEESHACELLNCADPPISGFVTLSLLRVARDQYRLQLSGVNGKLIQLLNDDSGEENLEAFVEEASTNKVDGWTDAQKDMAKFRALSFLVALSHSSDSTTDKQKAVLVKLASVAEQKSQDKLNHILEQYNTLEAEYTDLLRSDSQDKLKKVRQMWRDLDSNGSKKATTVEVNSYFRTREPLLNQPRANKETFKVTSGEDGYLSRREFVEFLRNVIFFNKVFFLFAMTDTSKDRKVSMSEFTEFLEVVGISLSADDAAAEFAKADNSGNGSIAFTEFVQWVTTYKVTADVLKPIEDDEDLEAYS
jgi:Ca2+-binding EF-hand superfamily protein